MFLDKNLMLKSDIAKQLFAIVNLGNIDYENFLSSTQTLKISSEFDVCVENSL